VFVLEFHLGVPGELGVDADARLEVDDDGGVDSAVAGHKIRMMGTEKVAWTSPLHFASADHIGRRLDLAGRSVRKDEGDDQLHELQSEQLVDC